MQAWALTDATTARAQAAVARAIGAIGRAPFASEALGGLHTAFGAASWSVYRLRRDAPPTLHLSASRGVPDTTAACFSIYRDEGLYRGDSSFQAVQALPQPGAAVMLRMRADEAPSADHRDAIYRRHGISERLSVACLEDGGGLLAVNLYCHAPAHGFAAGTLEGFGLTAATLLAAVQRHLDDETMQVLPPRRERLRQRCAQLTERELDVLEALLDGLTYDGIAARLGLSVATVKTYRARAFERLGLHFRSQLFAAFAPPGA